MSEPGIDAVEWAMPEGRGEINKVNQLFLVRKEGKEQSLIEHLHTSHLSQIKACKQSIITIFLQIRKSVLREANNGSSK